MNEAKSRLHHNVTFDTHLKLSMKALSNVYNESVLVASGTVLVQLKSGSGETSHLICQLDTFFP